VSTILALLHVLGTVLAALALVLWAITFASTVATLYLVMLHWRLRPQGLADETRRLATPLPADAALPHVVVQIPTFNEGAMVARAVEAATRLDWPGDRLTIEILDDSTDGSLDLSRAIVARLRGEGVDVVLRHRGDRSEFKAGALAQAMRQSPHHYFAIFDVDYVPPRDFLRKAMSVLLAEPRLAFVQARFDYFNASANALTRTQAVLLDAHLAIEQATRCWAGHPLPFNGTCGIWRRAAIDAAGGWHGDTLAEDLELSYRAWRIGWRGRFLMTLAVPGELPETMQAWVSQQRRWTKGFGEVALRTMVPVLGDPALSLKDKVTAWMHLGAWWSGPAWALALPCGVVAMLARPDLVPVLGPVLVGQILVGYIALFVFLRSGSLSLRPGEVPLGRFLRDFVSVSRNLFKIGASIGPAQREVILRRRSEFERTPKTTAVDLSKLVPAPSPAPGEPDGPAAPTA
jgi:cellulose synthase/poly-beta-1,6-N-acetylglucosamine synthase-like glycosyltransferase